MSTTYDQGIEQDRERHESRWVSGIESCADELLTDEATGLEYGGEMITEFCGAANDAELLAKAKEYRDKGFERRREAVEGTR